MTRFEYLKLAIQSKCFTKREWLLTAFALTRVTAINITYTGQLKREDWGMSCVNSKHELEKIDDYDGSEPLYSFKDRITIDSTWCQNVKEPIETQVGNLIFNCLCLESAFGNKIDFITGKVNLGSIDNIIASKLQSTPKDITTKVQDVIYIDEYVNYMSALQFLSTLTQLTTYGATPKTLVGPPGIKEFKQKLAAEYGDTLTDPVKLAEFESKLLAYDAAYLKGDPADGTFVTGKIKNIARKKMFLSIGSEAGFDGSLKANPVLNSLEEGLPESGKDLTTLFNAARAGSFSRGFSTKLAGTSAKALFRVANSFGVLDRDCGTKLGIRRYYDKTCIDKLVGRYLIDGTFIETLEIAKKYLDTNIVVRSPMYCTEEGTNICKVCAGFKLSQFPDGLAIPITEISGIFLSSYLKAMHSQVLATAEMNINTAFT